MFPEWADIRLIGYSGAAVGERSQGGDPPPIPMLLLRGYSTMSSNNSNRTRLSAVLFPMRAKADQTLAIQWSRGSNLEFNPPLAKDWQKGIRYTNENCAPVCGRR